jgi:Cu/Ag efflux protein CusF
VKATQANDVKTATEIEVQNENENEAENEVSVSGVVKSVGADSLVVTTGGGDVTVNVDAATIIRMKQNAITLADIKVGDRVEAEGTKVDDHTLLAKHIQVEDENESEAEIHGAVKSVGTSSLVVTTATGDVTVNVDSSTVIRKQGVVITLADIKVGDEVEAEGTLADAQTLNATKIQVENPNEIENDDEAEIKGTVKSVGTSSLVVTTSKGDITVMVDSSTEIRRHGDHLALSDIKAGNQVEAEGTMIDPQTLKAKKISVEGGH